MSALAKATVDKNSFAQIVGVVSEHVAYQGCINVDVKKNPYLNESSVHNYHHNQQRVVSEGQLLAVKKKAFISHIAYLGFPGDSIKFGLSSEEVNDLLRLQTIHSGGKNTGNGRGGRPDY